VNANWLAPTAPPGLRPVARPSFSVLVPLYNGAATVVEAVTSALDQTLAPAEVIVCDDGSSDHPEQVLRPFDGRITLVRQPNRGAPAARNAALARASGDFVAVLDADDVWEPARLERLATLAAARPDLDILGTDLWFERDGKLAGRFLEANPFPQTEQDLAVLRSCFLSNPAIRRTRLEGIGGFDPRLPIAEDWDVLIRLILAGARAGVVDAPLARYRLAGDSLTAKRARSLRHRVMCLEKVWREGRLDSRQRDALRRSLAQHRLRAVQAEVAETGGRLAARSRAELLRCSAAPGLPIGWRWRAAAGGLAPRAIARELLG
jgi:glycosyltransferase involved in cell wall biosynthesis